MTDPLTSDVWHRERLRREQRRIARACHPDLGADAGADPERFTRLMRELGAANPGESGSVPTPGSRERTPAFVVVRTRPTTAWRRRIRASKRRLRAARALLPRRIPGTRRYIDL